MKIVIVAVYKNMRFIHINSLVTYATQTIFHLTLCVTVAAKDAVASRFSCQIKAVNLLNYLLIFSFYFHVYYFYLTLQLIDLGFILHHQIHFFLENLWFIINYLHWSIRLSMSLRKSLHIITLNTRLAIRTYR